MDRRRFLIGSAGLLGAAAAGCAPKEEPNVADPHPRPRRPAAPPPTAATGGVTFAIIPKMLDNPVFTLAQRGAEKAAREIGGITIEFNGSRTGVPAEQAEVIRTMTEKRVAGMAISVVDAAAVRDVINQAVDQGIPVICFDSDCPDSKRRTFTSVDNKRVGSELAARLVETVGGAGKMQGEVAVLSGQATAPNLLDRVAAARMELAKYPSVTILDTIFCDDKEDVALDKIRLTTEIHQDLRGWIMVGGWPLFRPNALDPIKNFERTKVVAVDALPVELDYVERGQVACLLAQRCFGWGEDSVHLLNRLRTDRSYNPPPFIDAGYDLVFKEPTTIQRESGSAQHARVFSAAEYRKQWDAWNSAA
jgi:ribose transport system substrate-binding protein